MGFGYLERNDMDKKQELARDYFSTMSTKLSEYKDKRAGEWAITADWLYSHANDVYYDTSNYTDNVTNDPREMASRKMFVDSVRQGAPTISEEWLEKNYKGLIKTATGNDIDATGLFDVFGQKVAEGYKSFASGVVSIGYMLEDLVKYNSSDDYEDKKRKERQDKFLSSISGKVRTDYYNEYDNFIQKAILGLGDTLPSLLNSAPAMIGAVATGFTGNPLFMTTGRVVSSALNFTMEYGSLVQSLRDSGATPEQIMLAAGAYAGVSTAIEYNFDKIPENILAKPIGQWLRLYKEVDGLGTKAIASSVGKVFGNRLLTSAVDWLSETGEEMLQQLAEDWTYNLLDKYRREHGQEALPDWMTATPEEMWQDFVQTGKDMGTTQTLLSVGEMLLGLGFDVNFGNIKAIVNSNRYTSKTNKSRAVFTNEILGTNGKVEVPKSIVLDKNGNKVLDKDGNQTYENGKFNPVKGKSTSIGIIPDTIEEANKVGYVKGKNERLSSMQVEDSDIFVEKDKATKEEAEEAASYIEGKNKKGEEAAIAVNDNGEIEVDTADIGSVVREFIVRNYDKYQGIQEVSDKDSKKFMVTVGDKTYTFTTEHTSGATQVTKDSILAIMNKDKGTKISYIKQYFEKNLTSLFKKAGYEGDKLTNAVSDYKALAERLNGTATNLVEEIKKLNPNADPDLQEQIVYGISGMTAEFAPVLGFESEWARDHVVLDDKVANSKGIYGGSSYWEVDGKTYKNFKQIPVAERANANFHIAVSELVNQTTGIHEIGHMALSLGEQKFLNDDYFKTAFYEYLKKDNEGIEDEREWKIGNATHEAFAEKLEAYINTGVAESKEQASLFNRILRAFKTFLDKIKESLTGEQLEFYDRLFGNVDGLNETTQDTADIDESDYYDEDDVERNQTVSLTDEAQKQYDDVVATYKDTDQWLKAPNGVDSNLDERLWVLVRTDNFKEWFGDWENEPEYASKMVDENGEPKVYYHGTGNKFEEFIPSSTGTLGYGIYFFPNRKGSENWAHWEGKRTGNEIVIDAFLCIKNPLVFEYSESYWRDYVTNFDRGWGMTSELIDKGYDGIVYYYNGVLQEVNAFDPMEVKSTDNNGEFSLDTREFRHQTVKNADMYKRELEILNDQFKNGKMVDPLVYNRYEGKTDWIPADRIAQRLTIDGDMVWMQNLLTNIIYDYMETSKFTYDDITDEDWEKISKLFIKQANDKLADREKRKRNAKKNEITDYFKGRDTVKVIRRIFAWSQNTDEQTKLMYWINKYTGRDSRAGDQHILRLARKLKARGDLNDTSDYKVGGEASTKYRFLDLVQKVAYKDGNYRTSRVNEAIWAGAQQEILDNASELIAIDQDVALTSGGKAIREKGIEDSDIDVKYYSITEKELVKARKKAEDAKEQTKTAKKELEDALKENDSIKAEMEDVNKTLAKTAQRIGVNVEGLNTTDELVEAIKKAGKDIAKEDSKLSKRIDDVKDKLKASNDKVRELRSDLLIKDREIADLKIQERIQERTIIRNAKEISSYIEKLKEEKRADAAYRKVVEKTIKEAENAIEAMTDLRVENEELAKEIKAKATTIREQSRDLKKKESLLNKEYKTNKKLKTEIEHQNAEIAQLDDELAEAFYNLKLAIKYRDKYWRQRNNLEEELAYVRTRRLIDNSRRNWHELLRKKSGDATMDKSLEAFDKAFFQRNDTFKILDIDGNKDLKSILSMSGTLVNSKGERRFVDSIYTVLEKNGLIKNGKLIGGFSQLPVGQFKKMADAIKVARDNSNSQKNTRVEARSELIRDISAQANSDIEKLGLTKEQYKEARERYKNGEFETEEQAQVQVWADSLRYKHEGTKSQADKRRKLGFSVRKGINPNNNVAFNSFTSGYNLLGSISPALQKLFFFGNADMAGINQVTDEFLKKVEERKRIVEDAIKEHFNGDKKKINKFMLSTQKKVETRELDVDHVEAPRWLEMSNTWNNFLETQEYRSDFVDNELVLEEVMAIYEHAKQEEDLAHLLNDRTNLSARQVAWIVNEFEKEDGVFHQYKDIADAYQKAYEKAWDRFQKVANDIYDVALTHYDFYSPARSADNDTDITLGYDFDANGNPLKYGKKMTMAERADMQMKTGGNNPIRLSYISSFNSIVRSQEWFINGAEFFKNWNDIMKNDGGAVRRMIDERIGSQASDTVMKWMRSVANSEFDDVASGINKVMDGIRNRMALANLGFSVSSTFQQPSVLFLAGGKFGVKNIFKAMSAIKSVGGFSAFRDYVHSKAPQIKASADLNLMYAKQAISDSKFLKAIGLAQDIAEIGMKGIEFSDQICRCITWQAGYQYYLDKGMSEDEASMYATQDTMNMNSSRQAKDNSLAYNSKNPLWKAMLLFTNQLNKQWNMLIGEDGVQALLNKDIKTFVGTVMGLGLATSWVLLAKGKLFNNNKDDEEWWEDLWLDYLGEGISVVPVIGDKISSVINGYSYLNSDLVTSTSNFIKTVVNSDGEERAGKITTAWKNMTVDFLELIGAPKVMFKNTYNALFEDGKWRGDDFFSEGRYWRTILPYEWYQFVTGDKD